MNSGKPMVLKKKKKLDEEVTIAPNVERGSIDIDNPAVRSDINNALKTICLGCCITPYIALEKARKVLANFHIIIPGTQFLEGPSGSRDFPASQFGDKFGMNNQGEFVQKTTSEYTIRFKYDSNQHGSFDCSCELVAGSKRSEEKVGAHPRDPNTMPRMNGPETGHKPITNAPGLNEGIISNIKHRINGRREKVKKDIELRRSYHLDALSKKNGGKSKISSRLSNSDPDPKVRTQLRRKSREEDETSRRQKMHSVSMYLDPETSLRNTKNYMTGKGKKKVDEGVVAKVKRVIDKASGNQLKRLSKKVNQDLDNRQKKVLGHLTKDNDLGTDAGQDQFHKDWKTLIGDKRYNSLIGRHRVTDQREFYKNHPKMRTTDYLSGKGKPKEKTKEERVASAATLRKSRFSVDRYISKPIKESSVSDDTDLVKLAHDEAREVKKRERDKQPKKASDSAIARLFNKPKSIKEDEKKDRVSSMMWRSARIAQKAHKQDGEYRAKIALRNKIGSSKYRKNMELSDDNFSISDQQGQIADKHLDGAKRDHDRRLAVAVSKAKAKGYMQEENIDEGTLTKSLPGIVRKQITKFKASRHYAKAREEAGKEYSASVKSKDITKSHPAAFKMGRLGRKARNIDTEVLDKGKNFFRGKRVSDISEAKRDPTARAIDNQIKDGDYLIYSQRNDNRRPKPSGIMDRIKTAVGDRLKEAKRDSVESRATDTYERMKRSMDAVKSGRKQSSPGKQEPSTDYSIKKAVRTGVDTIKAQKETEAVQKHRAKERSDAVIRAKIAAKVAVQRHAREALRDQQRQQAQAAALENPAPARKPEGVFSKLMKRVGIREGVEG